MRARGRSPAPDAASRSTPVPPLSAVAPLGATAGMVIERAAAAGSGRESGRGSSCTGLDRKSCRRPDRPEQHPAPPRGAPAAERECTFATCYRVCSAGRRRQAVKAVIDGRKRVRTGPRSPRPAGGCTRPRRRPAGRSSALRVLAHGSTSCTRIIMMKFCVCCMQSCACACAHHLCAAYMRMRCTRQCTRQCVHAHKMCPRLASTVTE